MRTLLTAAAFIIALGGPVAAQERVADWVTVQTEDARAPGTVVYHKTFNLDFDVEDAYLKFTCYTSMDFVGTTYRAYTNNIEGAKGSFWQDVQYMNLSHVLRNGDNEIDIEVSWVQMGTPGPVLAKLVASGVDKDGNQRSVVVRSDESWVYFPGKFDMKSKTDPGRPSRKVTVAGAADQWTPAKNPRVLPKINTSTVVGVTDVAMKGGNAGSLFQFNLVRDYSDKFYFLKTLGYHSIEDYIFGQTNYQVPGKWFWGYDRQIAHNQEKAGFDFTVYPWVWVPAEWYRKQASPPMVKCIEHGEEGFGLSLWGEEIINLNEDIYADLKRNFGDSIRFVYPGIYGDFGEAHYMAGWNTWLHPKPEHQHAGFWAGEDLARADFRGRMLGKYGTLDALNKAWGTSFAAEADVAYPKLDGTDHRRYAIDFINWYYDSMTEFTARVCAIAKKHFPDVPMAPKLGCGDENPMWGQDNSAIPEALAKLGVGIRSTHGSSPNSAVRRISSACKFYGNDFETETAGGTNRQEAARKFFIDASSGCAEIFEYPNAIITVADIFSQCRRHLRGEHSITEIALFFATSWHRSNLRQGYPPKLVQAAEEMRDMLDFDMVDENMALDGALKGYRVLAMFDGDFTENAVYECIMGWVERGGTLVVRSEQLPFSSVEGEVLDISEHLGEARSGGAAFEHGKGQVIIWDGEWGARSDYYTLIRDAAYPQGSERMLDGVRDGVWTSLFRDRALYLNTTDSPVQVTERISEDVARRLGLSYKPGFLNYAIEVPPHSQTVHLLDRPLLEFAVECEEMDGANKHPIEVIYRGGYGTPGRAVKLPRSNYVRATVTVDAEADYGFYCVADLQFGGAGSLELNGKKLAEIKGASGRHGFMYPLAGKARLRPGKHTLIVRCSEGSILADKVMVTTDTGLAGFAYGFIDPQADQTW